MSVTYPDLLWIGGIVVVLVLIGSWRHAVRRARLAGFLGGGRAVARLSARGLVRPRLERVVLLAVAAATLALAAAEPLWTGPEAEPPPDTPPRSVVFAIDVSASMQATDVAPTRLGRAARIVESTMESIDDDRVGLLLFAGSAYPLTPPTHDHRVVRYLLDGVTSTVASAHDPGTLLSGGIDAATAMLASPREPDARRSIVLISDGGAGEPDAAVVAAVSRAAAEGIEVHVVGVGTEVGSRLVMPQAPFQLGGPIIGPDGVPVVSRIREPLLTRVAEIGGGSYVSASDAGQVESFAREFARPPPPLVPAANAPAWAAYDLTYLLAAIGLLCLLLDGLLDARLPRLAPLPRRRPA